MPVVLPTIEGANGIVTWNGESVEPALLSAWLNNTKRVAHEQLTYQRMQAIAADQCARFGITHPGVRLNTVVGRRRGLPVMVRFGCQVSNVISTEYVGPGPDLEYQTKGGKCWWPSSKPSGNVAKWRVKESA